jgi:hypothetical protein
VDLRCQKDKDWKTKRADGQREYAWDGENRMIELILNEDQFTRFFYDGLNRCVKIEEWSDGELEEVRHIIWDGLERVERKNAALQTVRRYFAHGFQTVRKSWGHV